MSLRLRLAVTVIAGSAGWGLATRRESSLSERIVPDSEKISGIDDRQRSPDCFLRALQFTTSYPKLWSSAGSDRPDSQAAVEADLAQALGVLAQTLAPPGLVLDPKEDAAGPSEQLKGDIRFLQQHALHRADHLAGTAFANASRAFELLLGNALLTYEPVTRVVREFALEFMRHMEEWEPDTPPAEYASAFTGMCFAGFSVNLAKDTTRQNLRSRVQSSNTREIFTRFYSWASNWHSERPWQRLESSYAKGKKEGRMLDLKAHVPRFRMPRHSVGTGWLELQRVSSPSRAKLKLQQLYDELEAEGVFWLLPRRDTLDPPLSWSENARLTDGCPHTGLRSPEGSQRLQWMSGNAFYVVEESSPLWLLSQITGLPVVAGSSGTGWMLMSTAETMGWSKEDLMLLRLGLIGWMAPYKDHSVLEVAMGCMRSFQGRSFPKWTEEADATPTARDWQSMYENLLPEGFQHKGASLDGLNKHISAYLDKFNKKHDTSADWPRASDTCGRASDTCGESAPAPWWGHPVFDYSISEISPVKVRSGVYPLGKKCSEIFKPAKVSCNDESHSELVRASKQELDLLKKLAEVTDSDELQKGFDVLQSQGYKYKDVRVRAAWKVTSSLLQAYEAELHRLRLPPDEHVDKKESKAQKLQQEFVEHGMLQRSMREALLLQGIKPDKAREWLCKGRHNKQVKYYGAFGQGNYLADDMAKADQYSGVDTDLQELYSLVGQDDSQLAEMPEHAKKNRQLILVPVMRAFLGQVAEVQEEIVEGAKGQDRTSIFHWKMGNQVVDTEVKFVDGKPDPPIAPPFGGWDSVKAVANEAQPGFRAAWSRGAASTGKVLPRRFHEYLVPWSEEPRMALAYLVLAERIPMPGPCGPKITTADCRSRHRVPQVDPFLLRGEEDDELRVDEEGL